jgi:photosystem II stability/assembly factor-like uncharacterized protein
MIKKKFPRSLSLFLLLFSTLLSSYTLSVLGQTAITNSLYLPIVIIPPKPPDWVGPDGGFIITIEVAVSQPSTLYAGTWGSGIYKSTDGGKTWYWKSQGLENFYVSAIAVDPNNSKIAYAGTYTGKVFKTTDGGENWFHSSTNIQDQAIVYSIAIDPKDSDIIYICTRGESNHGNPPWNGVLYRSTDAGNTWTPKLTNVGGAPQEDWCYSVTLHPQFTNLVYAATHEYGIYRSQNYGKHWDPVNQGISSMSTRGIVVNPHSPEEYPLLYTGVWKWQGVFRSNNGGDIWYPMNSGSEDTRIFSMSINPKDGDVVYASTFSGGVLKTSNGGSSWKITGLEEYEITKTAINPQDPQLLYAGTNGDGLYQSANAGKTWKKGQQGLHATNVSALQISTNDSLRYFAGLSKDGVKQTLDGGQTWSHLGSNLDDSNILDLVMPSSQTQILFALTSADGLHRCNLEGSCWEKISIDFPKTSQIAFNADHPFWMRPMLEEEFDVPAAMKDTPALLALRFDPVVPQIAYLGTSGAGVFKSDDGGSTWTSSGLPNSKIVSIVVDPIQNNQVYAASDTRVWSSDNGGENWMDSGLLEENIYVLASDQSGNLFTGTQNGVYQLTQTGWEHLGLAGLPVTVLAPHPDRDGWLYAGTNDGLRVSRDQGHSWTGGPVELSGLTIRAITFDPTDSSWLFISTKTQGVLRMQH